MKNINQKLALFLLILFLLCFSALASNAATSDSEVEEKEPVTIYALWQNMNFIFYQMEQNMIKNYKILHPEWNFHYPTGR